MPEMSWLQAVQLIGIPASVLFFMLWMIWRAGAWFGTRIIEPYADREMSLREATASALDKIAGALDAIALLGGSHHELVALVEAVERDIADVVRDTGRMVADTVSREHRTQTHDIEQLVERVSAIHKLTPEELAILHAGAKKGQ